MVSRPSPSRRGGGRVDPDELLGERVCIVVVPNGEPPTLDDIVEYFGVLTRDLRDQIRKPS